MCFTLQNESSASNGPDSHANTMESLPSLFLHSIIHRSSGSHKEHKTKIDQGHDFATYIGIYWAYLTDLVNTTGTRCEGPGNKCEKERTRCEGHRNKGEGHEPCRASATL